MNQKPTWQLSINVLCLVLDIRTISTVSVCRCLLPSVDCVRCLTIDVSAVRMRRVMDRSKGSCLTASLLKSFFTDVTRSVQYHGTQQ